jgi:hypothetical protein
MNEKNALVLLYIFKAYKVISQSTLPAGTMRVFALTFVSLSFVSACVFLAEVSQCALEGRKGSERARASAAGNIPKHLACPFRG